MSHASVRVRKYSVIPRCERERSFKAVAMCLTFLSFDLIFSVVYWEGAREAIKEKAKELGFSRAGVTTAEPSQRLAHYEEWIGQGKHGEMG